MLQITGIMMGGLDAVEYLEMLPDNIPDEIKDDDFCEEYEKMLNRVRWYAKQETPIPPKVLKAQSRNYNDFYTCGNCGFWIRPEYNHCPKCGRRIKWKENSK